MNIETTLLCEDSVDWMITGSVQAAILKFHGALVDADEQRCIGAAFFDSTTPSKPPKVSHISKLLHCKDAPEEVHTVVNDLGIRDELPLMTTPWVGAVPHPASWYTYITVEHDEPAKRDAQKSRAVPT
eukprot:2248250-Prymnesium_polylepis.1